MIQLGIFARTFVRPSLIETLMAVRQTGVSTIQINLSCAGLPTLPETVEPGQLAQIQTALEQSQLHVAALSGTFNMIHPDHRQRAADFRRFPGLLAVAAQLRVPVVTLCSGTRSPEDMWQGHRDNDSLEAWRELLAGMEQLLAVAETVGVTLAVEPEGGNVIQSAVKCRRLLDELRSPRLGVVFDAANLLPADDRSRDREVIDKAFDLLGANVVLAHAKELAPDGRPDGRGAGRGILEWDHLRRRLCEAGFAGAWVLHGLSEVEVPASVAFLRRHLPTS